MDKAYWSILASLGSFVGMLITLIVAIRTSSRNRVQEIQEVKDDLVQRQEERTKEDRQNRKAIYDEIRRVMKDIETTYVRKEMCEVIHGSLKEGIDSIQKGVRRISEMDGD